MTAIGKQRLIKAGFAAVLTFLALGGLFAARQKPLADVATGYMARVACACHFVADRPLTQCYDDGEAGMEQVRLSADAATRTVRASIPLLSAATATHTPGLGCVLNKR
jgi:hypothetical protein